MYTFQSRIRYSEVGIDGNLTLESLLDYFQDASTFHSEDIGLGVVYLQERHLAWVLSAWQIVVERYPHLCENVIIGTLPYDFKGFIGYRNFWMDTEAGERLAYANSVWTLMDMEKRIPARPPAEMIEGYAIEDRLDMDYAPRKIAVPSDGELCEARQVKAHHLDTNGHVNNGQYVRMAMDYIPDGFSIRQLRAEYKKQAVLHDTVIPAVAVNPDKTLFTISLNGKDDMPYSIVELTGAVKAR